LNIPAEFNQADHINVIKLMDHVLACKEQMNIFSSKCAFRSQVDVTQTSKEM
jgi:hypothetical protein